MTIKLPIKSNEACCHFAMATNDNELQQKQNADCGDKHLKQTHSLKLFT